MIAPRITTIAIRLTWRGMTTGSGAAAAEEMAFMRTGRFFRWIISSWGSPNPGPTILPRPVAVAFDSGGNAYVAR